MDRECKRNKLFICVLSGCLRDLVMLGSAWQRGFPWAADERGWIADIKKQNSSSAFDPRASAAWSCSGTWERRLQVRLEHLPIKDHLSAFPGFHDLESALEFMGRKAVGDDGG